jgi:sugar lactone lactonase YvrE
MSRLPMLVLGALAALLIAATAAAKPFPEVIALPDGFQPEGIAISGTTFYVGSIPTGDIYRGDVRTGEADVFVDAPTGRAAIGLEVDARGRLFVAGGGTGDAYVYDAETGDELAVYDLAGDAPSTFVNDVVVTQDAAWFTDSRRDVLYKLPLGPGGTLPDLSDVEELELGGEFEFATVPSNTNLNGIEATPDGRWLIAVQSNLGRLYRIDPETGDAVIIELDGLDDSVVNGDGLLLDGRTLYVVQNRDNKIAVIELAPDFASGTIVRYITEETVGSEEEDLLDVPTTLAELGNRLYAVNARFGTQDPQPAKYWVAQLPK